MCRYSLVGPVQSSRARALVLLLAQSAVPSQVAWTLATYMTSDCSDAGTANSRCRGRPRRPSLWKAWCPPTGSASRPPRAAPRRPRAQSQAAGGDLEHLGAPIYRENLHLGSTDCRPRPFPQPFHLACASTSRRAFPSFTCFDRRKPKTVIRRPGWTAGWGAKCMKLVGPATTHEGRAAACGANASLACIQSQEDQELARLVVPVRHHVLCVARRVNTRSSQRSKQSCRRLTWGHRTMGSPWGHLLNGQRAFYQATFWGGYFGYPQLNNYNLGEDCMAWSTAGFADNVCTEHRQCLCEWPSQTSAVYVSTHGPALTQRAHDAFAAQSAEVWRYWGLGIAIGCLPALLLVLVIECYLVRWRQRTAPTTPAEASLKATQRLALRRRMLQGGLSLWVGRVLIGLCIPPAYLTKDGIWPNYGYATTYPYGSPVYWKFLRVPAIMLLLLSIRGTDTAAIRLVAAGCVAYFLVEKLHGYDTWTSWEKTDCFRSRYTSLGPNPEPDPLGELWVRGSGQQLRQVHLCGDRPHTTDSRHCPHARSCHLQAPPCASRPHPRRCAGWTCIRDMAAD